MTDFGENAMGWVPRAASAALLLLGAACTPAYQASPPLEGSGAVSDTATAQINLEDLLNAPVRGTNKFGYLNQQATPTSYRTLFLAKLKPTYALTIKERNVEAEKFEVFAIDMTYLQAAKMALDNGYAGFTAAAPESFLHVVVKNNRYDDPAYRKCVETCQTLDCGCVPTYYDYATLNMPAGLGTYAHYDLIDARALLSFDMTKDVAPGAYDAKATIDKMHKQYPFLTAGSGEPAETTPGATPEATPSGPTPPEPQPAPPTDILPPSQPLSPPEAPPAPPPPKP